ncbi:MAG: ATP-binding protein [Firmicutes bacterium]|nr:ATP-binding protein [Bacillota bacterium]
MQVVGTATQQEVWVASRDRKFVINELLVIEDPERDNPVGEVVNTSSLNRYLPLAGEKTPLVDEEVLAGLRAVGYRIQEEEIHLARVRLLREAGTPVAVGARVRRPAFLEVARYLLPARYRDGLVLGVIRGTGHMAAELPGELRDVLRLYDPERGLYPQDGVPFIFDHYQMHQYPHIGIFGGSGSGKSFGLRVLLEELMERRIPAVVLDPHLEMDFSEPFPDLPPALARDYRGRFAVFTVGLDVGVDFTELTSRELAGLLDAVSSLTDAMINAVETLHRRRDSLVSFSSNLRDLIRALEEEKALQAVAEDRVADPVERERIRRYKDLLARYKDRVGGVSTLNALSWRLNFLEKEGIFTAGTAVLEEALQRRQLAVVRGPVRLLGVYAAYLFRRLYARRREFQDARARGQEAPWFPPFVLATDEAHHFAPRGEREVPARGIIREIAQEGRKYGVFLILATQRPALLDDTVTAQLNTKIIFRTVRAMDIAAIEQETDLVREELARLPYLPSGNAFVSSALVGRTVPVRIRAARTASPHVANPFDELAQRAGEADRRLLEVVGPLLPLGAFNLDLHLPAIRAALGGGISFQELLERLRALAREGFLRVEPTPFGEQFLPGR